MQRIGEQFLALATALLERCDEVWNMYGPTETTVWSSCWQVQPDTPISLGRAIDNTQLLVLDDTGRLLPAGARGEIWIGGAGVADGYWQRPELTHERFRVLDHVPEFAGQRFYRTGDQGRWRHDGSLEHGGRLDGQVKLRGFRIELGEIEACLGALPEVQHCVALVREDTPGDQRLVAYIVSQQPMLDLESLRIGARQWLPEHMVPSQLVQLPSLPTLPNGKIDRQSLPKPSGNALAKGRRRAPRTETEKRVLRIWQELLQVEDLGIDDNFFEMGGHSMLAVRMIRRMEVEFQRPVWLNMLFEQPTVSAMALQLEGPGRHKDKSMALLRQGQQPAGKQCQQRHRGQQRPAQVVDHLPAPDRRNAAAIIAPAPENPGQKLPVATRPAVLAADVDGIRVATGEGALVLTELQRAGGKRLAAADFLRGFPLAAGQVLDAAPPTKAAG